MHEESRHFMLFLSTSLLICNTSGLWSGCSLKCLPMFSKKAPSKVAELKSTRSAAKHVVIWL